MELYEYEKEHLAKIRAGLSECMVLLKTNGKFPLDKPGKIAAYGSGVRRSVKGGTGSGEVNSRFNINIEEGLKQAGFTITTEEWLEEYDKKFELAKKPFYKHLKKEAKEAGINFLMYSMGAVMPEPEYDIALSGDGESAIYVLSRMSGEGNDRKAIAGDFLLTKTEIRDILALDRQFDKFMLVINAGGPVDLSPVSQVGNILVLSQLGVEMGSALADVLLGKTNPSGKLTSTWSAWEDYCPDIDFGHNEDTRYQEGIYVGYRYFDTVGKEALFPFGYGLSYTSFEIGSSDISVEETKVKVATSVKNIGERSGKEVVQVYLTPPEVQLKKPFQELVAFAKTSLLEAGEEERLELEFDLADSASFDEESLSYILEAGEYILRVGNSSVNTRSVAVLTLDEKVTVMTCRSIVPHIDFTEKQYDRVIKDEDLSHCFQFEIKADSFKNQRVQYDKEAEVAKEIANLSDEELALLGIGSFSRKGGMASIIGSAAAHVAGAAGETTADLTDKGFDVLVMSDGPAGLRLTRQYYEDEKGLHGLGMTGVPESMLENAPAISKFVMSFFVKDVKAPTGAQIKDQYCTAIPIGTAIAQTWNLEYAKTCGDVVGAEMERFGINLWLAPALNIHRSALCGRNFEYYSEDPLISGLFAAAITQGVQQHKGCGTTIKHFAANNQERNRYANNSIVSERALREIYLKGFAICVKKAQPKAVMTSYNLINGIHANEIRGLSEDYLRAENAFGGIIMTDWIVAQMPSSGKYRIAKSNEVAKAGGDLFMPGSAKDYDLVMESLKSGDLSRQQLEVNATRIFRMIKELVRK
ncbi:MAG: glycoside hydrolase family 3 C-terminal domain-containing protein [Clostridiales bacterium]|nr:glycoside hydrolase family 3 C-terminal domain-containing protein [Clostridiales bacterium]